LPLVLRLLKPEILAFARDENPFCHPEERSDEGSRRCP
jgi:hypothetical protein